MNTARKHGCPSDTRDGHEVYYASPIIVTTRGVNVRRKKLYGATHLKPNSITIAGSKLVGDQLRTS